MIDLAYKPLSELETEERTQEQPNRHKDDGTVKPPPRL
jgi:hypothetical protein